MKGVCWDDPTTQTNDGRVATAQPLPDNWPTSAPSSVSRDILTSLQTGWERSKYASTWVHLVQDKKVVGNTLLVNRAVLKFLYVAILKQKWFDEEIACPKRRPTLPGILS